MLAVVKTPRIDLRLEGDIPSAILEALETEYGPLQVEDGDEMVNIRDTEWYKETTASMTPGDVLQALRWKRQMSQTALAAMVGASRQNISAMECGRRPIGREMAVKLAAALGAEPSEFQSPWC